MPKIIMLKGLPGSGKTTWAKEWVKNNPGWIRVNKDDIRAMFSTSFSKDIEALVLEAHNNIIYRNIIGGLNIVVDNTGFAPKHERFLKDLCGASEYPTSLAIKTFDTPLEECIVRDAARANPVGAKVIKKMWREYVYKKPVPVADIPGLPSAIICDLDGTLALHNGRSPYDVEKCDTDVPNSPVRLILNSISFAGSDKKVIFVTGREDKFREKTIIWIARHTGRTEDLLLMRPTGDMREDSIVKKEIYNREIQGKYNVRFVLDDRNRVVNMWRRIGLTCFQVAEGDF